MVANLLCSTNSMGNITNPKQYVVQLIEMCNNVVTGDELLVKQSVQTLKGITFDCYTDLLPESIDSWEQMEQEFLNRFYNIERTISMTKLINTKQWMDETILNYINCWRALSLECKGRLYKALCSGNVCSRHGVGLALLPTDEQVKDFSRVSY